MKVSQDERTARMRDAVDNNSGDLLVYFTRRVNPVQDAADLLSETMLTVWRRIADLPDDPLRARMWMFGVARRVLANQRRAKTRHSNLAVKLRHQLIEQYAYQPAFTDQSDVREAIDELPASQRELVMLVHGDGITIAEAAKIMSTTASTARSRYGTALRNLKIALASSKTLAELQ